MANTLKFGTDGNWATKKGSTLAYNDENGNFKPLPFNFDRDTSATRVNKEGLIEVVSNNEPRIDYKDDSKGALLLEPSRSNLVTYSEDFSQSVWNKTNCTIISNNSISPNGTQNADKLVENNIINSFSNRYSTSVSYTSGLKYTTSIFAKSDGRDLMIRSYNGSSDIDTIFDLSNGIVLLGNGEIKDYGNGWYRCSHTITAQSTINTSFSASFVLVNNSSISYQGDGTSGIYIYGAMLEQGYATSYIPTQGSVVTRNQDSCVDGGNDQVINSTEGVLYYESKVHSLNGDKAISVSTGSYNDSVSIGVYGGVFQSRIRQGGDFKHFISPNGVNLLNNNKIAIMYSQSNIKIFVNGSLKSTVSGVTFNVDLDEVNFTRADNTDKYYGLIKDLRVYNEALTDQELINLTKI